MEKKTSLHAINQNKLSTTVKGLAALYLFSVGYAIYTQRSFYADGAYFFLRILEDKTFAGGDDFSRHFAHYATQFIVVALIKLFHVRNPDVLSYAFGLGLYLPQIVSLAICYEVTRKKDVRFMLFPVIALFGVTMNLSFIIVHESHVISNIFWPLLFYIVLKNEYDWKDIPVVLVLGLIFIRSYEIALILGIILIGFQVLIMREKWDKVSVRTQIVWITLLVLIAVGVAIAVWSLTISTRHPGAREGFLSTAPLVLKHRFAVLSFAYIFLIALVVFFPKMAGTVFYSGIVVLLVIVTFWVSLIPAITPSAIIPDLHYHTRSMLIYMLPFLAIFAYLIMRNVISVPEFAWRKVTFLVSLLIVGQLTWQILATSQWYGFREIFKNELAVNSGAVRFEETSLNDKKRGMQLIRPMAWLWTNPTLSILWTKDKDVKTIILNPAGSWDPFIPLGADSLPRVEEYGFSFDKYKQSAKQ